MAPGKDAAVGDKNGPGEPPPRSTQIASRGIRTADDAANFQAALLGDIMTGAVQVKVANSACNAMGKLLKIVDMKHRYAGEGDSAKTLKLADPTDERRAVTQRRQDLERELAELTARERAPA